MAVKTIPVYLPEDFYAHLAAQAQRAAQSVDELVSQTLAERLPTGL